MSVNLSVMFAHSELQTHGCRAAPAGSLPQTGDPRLKKHTLFQGVFFNYFVTVTLCRTLETSGSMPRTLVC